MKNIKEIERATQGRVTIRDLRRAYDKHRMNGA
jgi:DNA-binding transcriptional regulator YdaS (Cro superfamily)